MCRAHSANSGRCFYGRGRGCHENRSYVPVLANILFFDYLLFLFDLLYNYFGKNSAKTQIDMNINNVDFKHGIIAISAPSSSISYVADMIIAF